MKPREYVIADLLTKHKCKTMVEVGVKSGRVFGYVLKVFSDLRVWGVDLWAPRAVDGSPGEESYDSWDMTQFENAVRSIAAKYTGRATVIKGDSADSAAQFDDASIDLVFIDADHTEAGVARDIAAWWPKVSSGGILCGHDIGWPSVKAAVDKAFAEGYGTLPDIWWVQK